MFEKYRVFLQLFLHGKSIRKFLVAVIVGLGFSMSIVLSTLGLMDGFDLSMKKALRKSNGDLLLSSRSGGYFHYTPLFRQKLKSLGLKSSTPMIQTEGFVVHQQQALGVIIKGIDLETFPSVLNLPGLNPHSGGIFLGKSLAEKLQARVGEMVTLVMGAQKNKTPTMQVVRVDGIVDHGLYKKNLRFVYVPLSDLQRTLLLPEKVNMVAMGVEQIEDILSKKNELKSALGPDAYVAPFWQEYSSLLEAVQIEKLSLSLILQVVVVVAIFNILSFLIFLNEKKAKEIFLLEALGANQRQLAFAWRIMIFLLWLLACALAIGLTQLFDSLLASSLLIKIPESVYHLPQLRLVLGLKDYSIVFLSSFAWAMLLSVFIIRKMKKMPLLQRVRKEFGS